MLFDKTKAIYLQIADYIQEKILLNLWKENERIPSVREMAVLLEVNPNTVLRTYTNLQEEGVLYNQRGLGYYLSPNAYSKTLDIKRMEFFNEKIPGLYKEMQLLKIDIDQINDALNNQKHKGNI